MKSILFGAIIGDIVGSRFEFNNHRSKDFELFHRRCFITDDSIMTLAVANAVAECIDDKGNLSTATIKWMQELGRPYPNCGFGGSFFRWIYSNNPQPYNSFGNGAAMRVSACGLLGRSLDEAKELSKLVTEVSHDHPEGIKGAEATAVCVYLAKSGTSKAEIRKYVNQNYYSLDFTIDEIRSTYAFNETCQETVPQAIEAFLESENFEDAIRVAISVGGDSDTLAAITGAIAEAFYGIPEPLAKEAWAYFDDRLKNAYERFISKIK